MCVQPCNIGGKQRYVLFSRLQPAFIFQCHSSHSSQDLSCGNRSVFTVCCSPVGLSTITTTEDVWTCWLPWQRGLGKGCCCVGGVHRRRASKNNNNKWANWLCVCLCTGPVCPLCLSDDQLCSIESHNKGLSRKPLCVIVSQELCEILWQFVYPIQNRAGLGEGNVCLWFRL